MPCRPRPGADLSTELVPAVAAAGFVRTGRQQSFDVVSQDANRDPRPSGSASVDSSRAARRGRGRSRFADLCFETASLRVCGKGGREVRLPLPQDVGEALLDYMRKRPTESDYVFLRAVAPFQPFGERDRGHAVTHIARTALKRAGVQPPTPGAHVFRHTAACRCSVQTWGWMISARCCAIVPWIRPPCTPKSISRCSSKSPSPGRRWRHAEPQPLIPTWALGEPLVSSYEIIGDPS